MAELLWWHRAGQRVVLVGSDDVRRDCAHLEAFGVHPPIPDAVHTIRDVILHANGRVGLRLREILNAQMECSEGRLEPTFCASNFRPVRDTSIESLRALLSPTPDEARPFFREMIDEEEEPAAGWLAAGWRR